jgi:hypothetical protein
MGYIAKQMGHFNIIRECRSEHIVHNTRFPFQRAHTHFYSGHSYYWAKRAAYLALTHKLPDTHSARFAESLIRIADDEEYRETVRQLLETRAAKADKEDYCNCQKGPVRRR